MIKTYDGVALVGEYMKRSRGCYPEGSLTARTVVATIPLGTDPEATFQRVNAAITSSLIRSAEAVHADPTKLKRVKLSDEEVNQVTKDVLDAIE